MHRASIRLATLCALALAVACAAADDRPRPLPNILVIMTDDQGRWALGDRDERIATPNITSLARRGLSFDDAIAPTPVCSAARASLYTGRIASQHGVHDFLSETDSSRDNWLQGERLISEVLAGQGYRVGLFGKWHADTRGWRPQRGFHRWLTYDERNAPWINQYLHRGTVFFSSDGEAIEYTGFQAEFLTASAVAFIDAAAGSAPFAAFVNFVEPHFPFAGLPERLVERYRAQALAIVPHGDSSALPAATADTLDEAAHREAVAQYLAAVSFVDEQVGRLIDALEYRGLLDSTLILFTSDHGHMTGQYGRYGKGNATRPQNLYELSLRVPFIVAGPEAIVSARGRSSARVSLVDLFPTFAEIAGAAADLANYDGPGRSLLPLLQGRPDPALRRYQFAEMGNARAASDGRWKLVRYYPRDPAETAQDLWYDLASPRAERRPTPAPPAAAAQRLRSALEAYFARYESPEHSGRRIWDGPRHNAMEPWR